MSQNPPGPSWWDLHLRQARGEPLSEEERRSYEAEIARQDQELYPPLNIASLRELRATVAILAHDNAQLREQLARLEAELRTVEQALSQQTRQLLGVQE